MRVRLVDCVGYAVEGARGFDDEDGPRMVDTPWFEEPVSFAVAAETGTETVSYTHLDVYKRQHRLLSIDSMPKKFFALQVKFDNFYYINKQK